jgi:hypothetical protein
MIKWVPLCPTWQDASLYFPFLFSNKLEFGISAATAYFCPDIMGLHTTGNAAAVAQSTKKTQAKKIP